MVRLSGPAPDGDLAIAAHTLLAWSYERTRPVVAKLGCPLPRPDVVCDDGRYRVGSITATLAPIVTAGGVTPIVSNGLVTGMRIERTLPQLGLETGDVVIAVGGRLVTSRAMLAAWIEHAKSETTVTVRRRSTETVLHFVER